jgi:hypothetical protein
MTTDVPSRAATRSEGTSRQPCKEGWGGGVKEREIEIERDRERDRQRERETDRERQRDRQRDRDTDRPRQTACISIHPLRTHTHTHTHTHTPWYIATYHHIKIYHTPPYTYVLPTRTLHPHSAPAHRAPPAHHAHRTHLPVGIRQTDFVLLPRCQVVVVVGGAIFRLRPF